MPALPPHPPGYATNDHIRAGSCATVAYPGIFDTGSDGGGGYNQDREHRVIEFTAGEGRGTRHFLYTSGKQQIATTACMRKVARCPSHAAPNLFDLYTLCQFPLWEYKEMKIR